MLLHAILCFIITSQHDAKWPLNSVCMKMLSPVSLKWYNVTKTWLFPVVSNFHHLFKGGVSLLLYNVMVALSWKLKAIYVSLNLLVCIKHPYSIELTHLCCQMHFKLSPPSDALIVITNRKGKLLRHLIDQDIMWEFFCLVEKHYFSSTPFSDVTNSFSVKMNGWLGTIHQSLNRVDWLLDWLIIVATLVSKSCECKFYMNQWW